MPRYTWRPDLGAYVDAHGQPVPARVVREALAVIQADSGDRLELLAERFGGGELDTLGFREAARTELRTSYGLAAALALGGLAQLTPQTRGALSGALRTAYGFLDGFALAASQGEVQGDALTSRARSYAGGVHSTFEQFRRRERQAAGVEQERNVLEDGASHCDGCLAATDAGWQPLGSLDLPGARDCLANCRCEMEYQTVPAGEAETEAASHPPVEVAALTEAAHALEAVAVAVRTPPPPRKVRRVRFERDPATDRAVALIPEFEEGDPWQ